MREPAPRRCGTLALHYELLELYPEFRKRLLELEDFTAKRRAEMSRGRPLEFRIPVVVHVIYAADEENITDDQVKSQIDALNEDFSGRNADRARAPLPFRQCAGAAPIQFHLARTAPDGTPTNGIVRVKTYRASFAPDDSAKFFESGGSAAWRSERYLNIWVCRLEKYQGYAQYPGGPANTDGVVIHFDAFGRRGSARPPFHLGRTLTHQVGHWLNLHHPWGDRLDCFTSDLVDDTPKSRLPHFGKPAFPQSSGGNGPPGNMFMNYMDYVDDDAMCLFTAGQVQRMVSCLASIRRGLSNGASG